MDSYFDSLGIFNGDLIDVEENDTLKGHDIELLRHSRTCECERCRDVFKIEERLEYNTTQVT